MTSFKVKVPLLNVRTEPVEDFTDKKNVVGKLKRDAPFESIGEKTNKLGPWYKDANEHWVWGEGLDSFDIATVKDIPRGKIDFQNYINERFDGTNLKSPIDYNFILNVDPKTKASKGKGVSIAILDGAINRKLSFKNQVLRPFNIDLPDGPAGNHASFIAGLIAGNRGILGVSPDVTLIELPVFEDGFKDEDIDKVFNFVNSQTEPIILNISQNIPPVSQHFYLQNFKSLSKAIIVAAAGLDDLTKKDGLQFPASLPNAISVGTLSKDTFGSINNIDFNERLDYIMPSFNYVSYLKDESKFERILQDTSSWATAIVSATIALLISNGAAKSINEIKAKLSALSFPSNQEGIANFLNIITPIK